MTIADNLDPRTKLFIVACLSFSAVILSHWAFLAGIFLLSILTLIIFKVNLFDVLKKLKMIFSMVIFIGLMQSVFFKGKSL